MKLVEIGFFTGQVPQMTDFYRRLLEVEPNATSDKMTIFFLNDTKIFIHYRYLPQEGELPPEDHHAFLVDDVDTCCQQLMNQGLDLEIPPQDF